MSRRLRVYLVVGAVLIPALASPTLRGQSGPTPSASGAPSQAATTTLIGSVVDASLTPLAGVAVTLERDGRVVAKTTTAADGNFRFPGLAAGTYRVRAERAGLPVVDREVRVIAGVDTVRMPIVLAKLEDLKADAQSATPAEANRQGQAPARTQGGVPPPPAVAAPPPPASYPVGAGTSTAVMGGAGRGGGGGAGGRGRSLATEEPRDVSSRSDVRDDRAPWSGYRYRHSGESYAHVEPNRFQSAWTHPLSTFGADVDTASYSNVRRFLSQGQLPPRDAVRVEEFVNAFRFDYDVPRDGHPIAMTTEIADCPWAPAHKLVLVGARARAAQVREIAGRNIVLLIDVSGSMEPADRLPLLKSALRMFVDTLQADDRLAIVTYAGSSGIALPSTPVRQRDVIQRAIASLSAGGSTNGGQGLVTAYRVARSAYISGGVNRVLLATDGDFNVGIVDRQELLRLIQRERESGVFLSVLGVGTGNLKDATMELLADRGNGHYAYLDSLQEARRVLVREADATLENVAKDVKFQVEFNPALVSEWKLIGYENRLMAAQDFNNDQKDGGEMGAGHTVTVLYEIVPVGVERPDDREIRPAIDPLRYQTSAAPAPRIVQERPVVTDAASGGEWLTVKARYKQPEGETSQLISRAVRSGGRVRHLPLASAVAEFGLLLRAGNSSAARWNDLAARVARLQAQSGQAAELASFAELVEIARGLGYRR